MCKKCVKSFENQSFLIETEKHKKTRKPLYIKAYEQITLFKNNLKNTNDTGGQGHPSCPHFELHWRKSPNYPRVIKTESLNSFPLRTLPIKLQQGRTRLQTVKK